MGNLSVMTLGFQFDTVAEFLVMGGHGGYVWAAYGFSALVLVGLVFRPLRQRRKFLLKQGMHHKSGNSE